MRQAISISDHHLPAAAGAFRGSLALLLAQQGELDEARELIDAGETQVRAMPEEHAKFLCKKGKVAHLAGDLMSANTALKEAQDMAEAIGCQPESSVGQAIAELTELLE